MKIKMSYVIVSTVVGREVHDILFLEKRDKAACRKLVQGKTIKTLAKVQEFTDNYMDISPVGIMDAMMELTGATHIWDDATQQVLPKREDEGVV